MRYGFLSLLFFILLVPSVHAVEREIRVGIYQNRPGVFWENPEKIKGFYVEMLEYAAQKEGWNIHYVPGSWSQGLDRLNKGDIDLLLAIAYTQEREKRYSFTKETVFSNWGQVYVKDLKIQSLLNLKDRTVAGMKEDIYTVRFSQLLKNFDISFTLVETSEYATVIQKVADGSVDAGVVSRSNGLTIEKEYDLFRSPIVCCPMEIRYATKKGTNQDLLDKLDIHVRTLKQESDSLYYTAMARWFGTGVEEKNLPAWLLWILIGISGTALLLGVGIVILGRQRTIIEQKLAATYDEKRSMEIKMFASSKLATLGEVATGVAHEINQPMTYISAFTQNLEQNLKKGTVNMERLKGRIGTVNQQIVRIDGIIRHLQTFGRSDTNEEIGKIQERVKIEQIIENTLMFLGERLRLKNIVLEKHFDANVPPISGRINRLEQVFINFFQNAIHALATKQDAKIVLSVRHLKQSNEVQILFSDNGVGMTQTVLEKMYEPFFTTKEVGEGTGLGLSIVYGIIQEHKGSLNCSSQLGQGTTFTLRFPTEPSKNS